MFVGTLYTMLCKTCSRIGGKPVFYDMLFLKMNLLRYICYDTDEYMTEGEFMKPQIESLMEKYDLTHLKQELMDMIFPCIKVVLR